jgi:hypothetical protein
VMGFDDIESAALMGLSTIRQQLWESGAEGARRLCAVLRGDRVAPLRQQLSLEVVPRASTAPVHAGRAERAADSPATTIECALTGKDPRDAGGHR